MAKIKISISTPDGKVKNLEVEGPQAQQFIGKKIGDELEGSSLGLQEKLQITGGSDKDGFPMRDDVHGGVRTKILTNRGTGFNMKEKGIRRRKTVHGNVITDDIVQLNLKISQKI